MIRCRFGACVLALLLSCNACADVEILALPPAAAERAIDLQTGDLLREADDPARLDVSGFLQAQLRAATGPVRVQRVRSGEVTAIELPPGRWDLVVAPPAMPPSATRDLAQEAAQALAAGDPLRAAALHLADAQLRARRLDYAGAATAFAAAEKAAPTHTGAIADVAALAFENNPDRTRGLQAAERAVAARRLSGTPAELAQSLQLLAFWRGQTRDNSGARLAAEQSLRLDPASLTTANAYLVIAFVAIRESQMADAEAALDAADALIAQIAPAGIDAANLLARRALLSGVRREGDAAGAAYERAVSELRRLAPASMLLGKIAYNAHLHALERRRYAQAEAFARESMASFTAVAPDGLEVGQARAALAEVLMRRTEFAEAESLLRESWAAALAIDPKSYEALSLQLQVGGNLARQRRLPEALAVYDALEAQLGAADVSQGVAQSSLDADLALYRADVLLQLDRCEAASAGAQAALARYAALERRGVQIFDGDLILSECSRRAGAHAVGITHARRAVEGLRALSAFGIQEAQAQFALARALRDQGERDAAIVAYRAAIAGLEAHRAQVGGSEEIRAQWAAQFQDFYHELAWLLAEDGDNAAVLELEAAYRRQMLLQLLGADHADLGATWAGPGDGMALQLPAHSALLSFVVGAVGTLAIVQRPGSQARVFRLGATRMSLVDEVDRMRLLSGRASIDPQALNALAAVSRSLYAQLIAPLAGDVSGQEQWLVVADGPLLSVPWAALVSNTNGEPRYLVEDHIIGVAPSAAVWALLEQRATGSQEILAFADPVPSSTGDGALRDVPARALPGARTEVEALSARFPGRVTSYFGSAASEAQLRAAVPAVGLIHLALHSVSDAHSPMASHIVLASSASAASASDDGRLHAHEIARELKLSAGLTVLSSCASAGGVQAGGEGLLGLIRALHLAGSRAVIGTHWPVADRSTARLMQEFYARRSAGFDSATALAGAQRAWLGEARSPGLGERWKRWVGESDALPEAATHPFHWAAFTHSGAAAD